MLADSTTNSLRRALYSDITPVSSSIIMSIGLEEDHPAIAIMKVLDRRLTNLQLSIMFQVPSWIDSFTRETSSTLKEDSDVAQHRARLPRLKRGRTRETWL
jgi:hypothetical protein